MDNEDISPGELEMTNAGDPTTDALTNEEIEQQANSEMKSPSNVVSTAPIGGATFSQGNLSDFLIATERKTKLINQTLLPLIEVALIELVSNTNNFSRLSGTISNEGENYNITVVYQVPLWVSTEVETDAISKDANYVFEKLKVIKDVIAWKQCSINTQDGTLTVQAIL